MRIVIVTGSYPPDVCGVGDYTFQLSKALREEGIITEVFCRCNWNVSDIRNIINAVKSSNPDLVHIQYPSVGFRKKLTPQIMSLAVPSIITIHEVTKAHLLRKISLYPFSIRSKHIIFTTPYERQYAIRRAPWIAHRSSVIPIGSNIKIGNAAQKRDTQNIVYFGLVRPNKGIEDVVGLAKVIKKTSAPFHIRMIGKPHPKFMEYYDNLRIKAQSLPITWDVDLPDQEVADILSRSLTAYMPFPDGVSERRGSLMALLANGVITITIRGKHTPPELNNTVLFCDTPEESLQMIQKIQHDAEMQKRLSNNARAYANKFTWDDIAQRHAELYARMMA